MRLIGILAAFAVVAVAIAATAMAMGGNDSKTSKSSTPMHNHAATVAAADRAEELRVTLDRLFGEHAKLAINATRKGYDSDRDFAAAATSLDRNSVELANLIGSAYGRKARNEFLNGKFKWRAHIGFFVDYTVALKKRDRAGQRKAVDNLNGYIGSFSGFLAAATNLPANAVRASITHHVMQLKNQIDSYSRGQFGRAYTIERNAYKHMFMTGDTIAAAIAKQKFRS
jgi:hypothetical protein